MKAKRLAAAVAALFFLISSSHAYAAGANGLLPGLGSAPTRQSVTVPHSSSASNSSQATSVAAFLSELQSIGATKIAPRTFLLDGGTATLTGNLSIPRGFTLVDRDDSLSITGNLLNLGKIFLAGSSASSTSSLISATNITNARTGLISSVAPAAISGSSSSLELDLSALSDIFNHGTISSAGILNLTAGHSIVNDAGRNIATITANNDANLLVGTGSLANTGNIISSLGNVNVLSSIATANLNVSNTGGTISALNGSINLRDASYAGSANLNFYGGNLLSQVLNINSGSGMANLYADTITGLVNVYSYGAHVGASTPNLVFGHLCTVGDPTYYNIGSGSSITLSLGIPSTGGADLAILAGGDVVVAGGGPLDTTNSGGGSSGNLLIVAGANITSPASGDSAGDGTGSAPDANHTTVVISNGGTISGGKIDLSGISQIDTGGTTDGSGGNVQLIAYAGTGAGSGTINAPFIFTNGAGTGTNGNVTLIAGATSGTAITTGAISTNGPNSGGSITLMTATPTIVGNPVSVIDGTIQAGSGEFGGSTLQPSNITTGSLSFTEANLTFAHGGTLTTGTISGAIDTYSETAPSITVTTAPTANALNYNATGDINLQTSLNYSGGVTLVAGGSIYPTVAGLTISTDSASGIAGNVVMVAGANFTQTANGVQITGASNSGGHIDLFHGSNQLTAISASGTTSGTAGGNVTFVAFDGSPTDGQGYINVTGGTPINTSGTGAANGSVTAVANYTSTGTAISFDGTITTGGGNSGSGNITMYTGTSNNFNITKSDASLSVNPVPSATTPGSITVNGALSTNSATVDVTAGLDLSTQSISGNSLVQLEAGHDVKVSFSSTVTAASNIIVAAGNDVRINGNIDSPGGILLVAGGSIYPENGHHSLSSDSASGTAGNITLVAGATFTDTGTEIQISGASATGGHIDLQHSNDPISSISAQGTASGVGGGNITFIAFNGLSSDTGQGWIQATNGFPITTSGDSASSGDVMVIANGFTGPTNAINFNAPITTSGGNPGSGNVTFFTGTSPNFSVTKADGSLSAVPLPSSATPFSSIQINSSISTNAASVNITTGGNSLASSISGNVVTITAGQTATLADGNGSTIAGSRIVVSADNDIQIHGDILVPTGMLMVAGGSIYADANHATLSTNAPGQAGNITLVAGASYTDSGANIVINGPTTNGGYINLGQSPITALSAHGTLPGSQGGNITLIAFNGDGDPHGLGWIALPAGASIDTSGNAAANGALTIVGDYTRGGPTINLSSTVSTGAGAQPAGNITLLSALIPENAIPLSKNNGGGSSAATAFLGTTLTNGAIVIGNDITAPGATVSIKCNFDVRLSNIDVSASASGNGGTITIVANSPVHQIEVANGTSFASYILSLKADAGTTTGDGGNISLTNNSTTGIDIVSLNSISVADGNGGHINIDATSGPLTFSSGMTTLSTSAANASHAGGSIILNGSGIIFGASLALSANGVGSGSGGTVTITTGSGAFGADLVVDALNPGFTASAVGTGGTINVTVGSGHSITVNIAGTLSADTVNLHAPNGTIISSGSVTATALIDLISGSILQPSGTLTTPILQATSTASGGISLFNTTNGLNAINLTLSAGSTGGASVTNVGKVNLEASNVSGSLIITTHPDTNGNGSINLAASTSAGTVTLASSENSAILGGTGGICMSGGFTKLTAASIVLSDADNTSGPGTGNGDISLATAASQLSANTQGNVGIVNSGSVTLNASSAGPTKTFSLSTDRITTDGQITLGGNITAGTVSDTGFIALASSENGGTGGIDDTGGFSLTAQVVNVSDNGPVLLGGGNGSIGSSTKPIVTMAAYLNACTTGDVFMMNKGSVNLNVSAVGPGKTFQLTTDPTATNSGKITIIGRISDSPLGQIGTIILRSSASGLGTGGIDDSAGQLLDAQTVTLSDDNSPTIHGGGNGDIGSASKPILTVSSAISANTNGNVYIQNTGAVTIGASSAGSSKDFQLVTDGTTDSGQITLAGSISAGTATQTGTIILTSSEINGVGGIANPSGFTLTAHQISLSDVNSGLGVGNLGNMSFSGSFPILTQTSSLTATANGYVLLSNAGAVTLNPSSAGTTNTFSLKSSGDITTSGTTTAENVTLQTTTGSAAITIGAGSTISASMSGGALTLLSAGGAVTITGSAQGDAVLISNAGSITVGAGAAVGGGGFVSLTTLGGPVTILATGNVQGTNVNITSSQVSNSGTVQSGNGAFNMIVLSSIAGGDLSVTGSGAYTSPAIVMTATHNLTYQLTNSPTTNSLTLTAGNTAGDTLNLATSNLSVLADGTTGDGGTISLSGASIVIQSPTTPLTLTANGTTGSGGTISFTSGNTTALTVGTAAGNLILSATGTNGGHVTVSTGGDLTVNTAQLTAAPTHGSGANVTLSAGNAGPGVLTIVGTLSGDATGTTGNYDGTGGSITLQTNIPTTYTVPVLSVAGTTNGGIDITNAGGGVALTQSFTNISSLSLKSTGGNGSISILKPIGSAATNSITLNANGTGKVTDAQTTLASSLTLASGTGAISVSRFNGTSVSANSAGTVAVTNIGTAPLSIGASTGSALTVKSAGNIIDAVGGNITAGSVLLQSTSKTGTVTVDAVIDATLKTITLIGISGITINSGGSLSAATGVTAASTGVGAAINIDADIEVSAIRGTIKLTAPGGVLAQPTTDMSALGSITISAVKGAVHVGTIGVNHEPTTVALSGFTGITTGAVIALNTITETATGAAATITVNGNTATTSLLTGIVTLTASGIGGTINVGASDISALRSISVAAGRGTVSVDKIGTIITPATVSVSAMNQLTTNGAILANGGITLKTVTTAVGTGNLTVNDNVSTSTVTGKITITTATPGLFDQTAGTLTASAVTLTAPGGITLDGNIHSTNAVAVTASKGSIAVGATSTVSSSAKTVTMSALNDLHELGTVTAHTGVTLKTSLLSTSSVLDVQNVSSDSGTISIIGSGASVNVLPLANIQVGTAGIPATIGKIIVENANKALGVINVANSTVQTFVTISATTHLKARGNGDVVFTIGPAPAVPVVGVVPGNATLNVPSTPTGPFFFGAHSIAVDTSGGGTVGINSVTGGRVIFNAGVNASAITIAPGAGTATITADPPPAMLPISASQAVQSENELIVDTCEDSDEDVLVDQPEPLKAVSY